MIIHLRLHGKGNPLCSLGFLPTFFLLFITISAPESEEMTAMTFARLSKDNILFSFLPPFISSSGSVLLWI